MGIEKLAYQAPVEEGVSVFTVNTEKAQKLLPRLPLTLMPVTQQQCLQQGMEYAAAAPKGRSGRSTVKKVLMRLCRNTAN